MNPFTEAQRHTAQLSEALRRVSRPGKVTFLTALAPVIWGSTYILFTQTLPVSHPLTMAALRSVPAGLVLLALEPRGLSRKTFARVLLLGALNISAFSGLLFVAAAHLPGGVAATLAATQPLFALVLAWPLLGQRPHRVGILSALVGTAAVGMLGRASGAESSLVGVLSAIAAAGAMASGVVLIKRFAHVLPPVSLAAWQLVLGGGLLLLIAPVFEGPPPPLNLTNLVGLLLLSLAGTALPFYLWTRGVRELGAGASFLGFLSPLVALALGAALAGEFLSPRQLGPIALLLGASALGATYPSPTPEPRNSQ